MIDPQEVLQFADSVRVLKAIRPLDLERIRRELLAAVDQGRSTIAPWTYARELPSGIQEDGVRLARLIEKSDLDPRLARLLLEKVDEARAAVEALNGTEKEFTAWGEARYGLPDTLTIEWAHGVLLAPLETRLDTRTVTPEVFREIVQDSLDQSGLDGWRAVLDAPRASRVSVVSSKKLVEIDSIAEFELIDVRRLLVHEVGVHARRYANAVAQLLPWAPLALGASAETEEGLAVWVEGQLGVQDQRIMRAYAARAMAVQLAMTSGVVDVARELAQYMDASAAVDIAIRVKRGMRDPNCPGGFPKDHAYASGFLMIDRLVSDENILRMLMATKWAASTLPLVGELVSEGQVILSSVVVPDPGLLDSLQSKFGT